jgi:hypothetical protein
VPICYFLFLFFSSFSLSFGPQPPSTTAHTRLPHPQLHAHDPHLCVVPSVTALMPSRSMTGAFAAYMRARQAPLVFLLSSTSELGRTPLLFFLSSIGDLSHTPLLLRQRAWPRSHKPTPALGARPLRAAFFLNTSAT